MCWHLKSLRSLSSTPTSTWSHKDHDHGHEWSTHIPFIPCQSVMPFLSFIISITEIYVAIWRHLPQCVKLAWHEASTWKIDFYWIQTLLFTKPEREDFEGPIVFYLLSRHDVPYRHSVVKGSCDQHISSCVECKRDDFSSVTLEREGKGIQYSLAFTSE